MKDKAPRSVFKGGEALQLTRRLPVYLLSQARAHSRGLSGTEMLLSAESEAENPVFVLPSTHTQFVTLQV